MFIVVVLLAYPLHLNSHRRHFNWPSQSYKFPRISSISPHKPTPKRFLGCLRQALLVSTQQKQGLWMGTVLCWDGTHAHVYNGYTEPVRHMDESRVILYYWQDIRQDTLWKWPWSTCDCYHSDNEDDWWRRYKQQMPSQTSPEVTYDVHITYLQSTSQATAIQILALVYWQGYIWKGFKVTPSFSSFAVSCPLLSSHSLLLQVGVSACQWLWSLWWLRMYGTTPYY